MDKHSEAPMVEPTPRSDAVCDKLFFDGGPKSDAPVEWLCLESSAGEIADVSRTLERELNASIERVKELEGALSVLVKWCDRNDWGAVPKHIESDCRNALKDKS